ncbi:MULTISPECIES: SidA/IucD/PvdA family monooxygenase [Streptomyces]|uniref:L-lysine N6-monooxygenase MbtG n=1 Tax=Streptomyces xanthochromogenes TaxID=67384 RepID=A0ABQ3AZA8_9ACTN|nr:SidA/IucD/PvdA family monooxygenase [Streptomyces xanthochromogenes]MYV95926.1 SidA/IucD/PvdA family monooxygenase [Streptomyces sp. SID1034]GGY71359.1 L-lysine 6-monooxygenase [Streptomyces xanthochromogenes]
MTTQKIYPVLGVGFGPANLSLAVALEERGRTGLTHFIERSGAFQWQEEQLLPGADIQNNPFRDLAMPRNPASPHTFVKYLAARGSLTDYLHLNAKFPLRREYSGYLAWVADAFRGQVDYGRSATGLSLVEADGGGELFRVETDDGGHYLAQNVSVGTGRSARIPYAFQKSMGRSVFHSTKYLSSIERLKDRAVRVAVVGASQSAIEIILDLLARPNVQQVTAVHRSIGFRLKDTSPYSRQVFLPEFVDYFHPLPSAKKRRLRGELRSINYAACDQDVIDRLVGVQREYELTGSDRLVMKPFSEAVLSKPLGQGHRIVLRDINHLTEETLDADVIILATGFKDFGSEPGDEPYHPLLEGIAHRLPLDDDGVPVVARDYSIELKSQADSPQPLRVYLNGLCEASHGMGDAGALAMLSVRATDIADSLLRYDTFDREELLTAGTSQ